MSKRTSAGGLVVCLEEGDFFGNILLCSQGSTNPNDFLSYSMPKGGVEDGESSYEAALREIAEETGVNQVFLLIEEPVVYLRSTLTATGTDPSRMKEMVMYVFGTNQTILTPTDPRNPEAFWVAPDKAIQMLTHPRDKQFVEDLWGSYRDEDVNTPLCMAQRGVLFYGKAANTKCLRPFSKCLL